MQAYAGDDGVFIRSMASRGHAGGLARRRRAAAAVLDAAGFDLVLIETVGTGQSEVEVAAIADTTVVVEAPEMGDEVQAIKAGLLEVADIVVVNKGDRPGAQRAAAQLRAMLAVGARATRRRTRRGPRPSARRSWWRPPSTGEGVPELLAALDRHRAAGPRAARGAAPRAWPAPRRRSGHPRASGSGDRSRRRHGGAAPMASIAAVAAHELDPYAAADRLLRRSAACDGPATSTRDASD